MDKCPNCGYDLFPMDKSCERCGQIIKKQELNNYPSNDKKKNSSIKKILFIILGPLFGLIVLLLLLFFVYSLLDSKKTKVEQIKQEIELGTPFMTKDLFLCNEGTSINLKEGYSIDTFKCGVQSAVFIISSGNKIEEETYTFTIIDSTPPEIAGTNITIYAGDEFEINNFVEGTDNSGEDVLLSIKSGIVDSEEEGEYPIIVEAIDSSGNITEKNIVVSVMSIDSPEDVMDLADEFLTKAGYTEFKYNKSDLDAIFITAPKLDRKKLSSDRMFSVYPDVFISESLVRKKFGCNSIIIRGEVRDEGSFDNRYNLRPSSLKISSKSGQTINPEKNSIQTMGEFERNYYVSRFDFSIKDEMMDRFEELVNSGDVAFEYVFTNEKGFYPDYTYETVNINYECSTEDIEKLKQVIEVYQHMKTILGAN